MPITLKLVRIEYEGDLGPEYHAYRSHIPDEECCFDIEDIVTSQVVNLPETVETAWATLEAITSGTNRYLLDQGEIRPDEADEYNLSWAVSVFYFKDRRNFMDMGIDISLLDEVHSHPENHPLITVARYVIETMEDI